MKLKRFETLNEAKKESTKKCEKLAIDFLIKELGKKAMSRADMLRVIESEKTIKDECDSDDTLKKVSRNTADTVIHDTKKYKLESETFINDKKGYNVVYFYIGKDAEMPKLKKLADKKSTKKVSKKNESIMITKFEKFNESKVDKVEESNKPGITLDEISTKVLNKMKDCGCEVTPLQLKTAVGDVKYSDVKNVLTKAQKDGKVIKLDSGKFIMKGPKK